VNGCQRPTPNGGQGTHQAFLADKQTASKVLDVITQHEPDRRVHEVVFQVWGTS